MQRLLILQGNNENQNTACHYQTHSDIFLPNSAYPLRLWSLGWAGKKEALFRKRGIIRSNLSPAEAEKLVSSFREERGGEDKELGRQGAEVCEKGSKERVKETDWQEKEPPLHSPFTVNQSHLWYTFLFV